MFNEDGEYGRCDSKKCPNKMTSLVLRGARRPRNRLRTNTEAGTLVLFEASQGYPRVQVCGSGLRDLKGSITNLLMPAGVAAHERDTESLVLELPLEQVWHYVQDWRHVLVRFRGMGTRYLRSNPHHS